MKRIITLFLALCFVTPFVISHSRKQHVIIDTDCGADDLRAITMILNIPELKVDGIVLTEGSLTPQQGLQAVSALLNELEVTGIPVYQGEADSLAAPPWRALLTEMPLLKPEGKTVDVKKAESIHELLPAEHPVFYICLGPLSTLAVELEKDKSLNSKIDSIFYYGTPAGAAKHDWNSERNMDALKHVSDSSIPVYFFAEKTLSPVLLDKASLLKINKLNTLYSSFVKRLLEGLKSHSGEGLEIWDELIPIFLNNRSTMNFIQDKNKRHHNVLYSTNNKEIIKTYIDLLGFQLEKREPVVLHEYPMTSGYFKPDVAYLVNEIRNKHGEEEWKAVVLTNELHRHLGIYSIIGAKMGIRAREILNAPFDEITVIAYSGTKPPLSCMSDGLQVSTGASLGRGTIEVSEDKFSPSAVFIYGKRKLELSLKPEVISAIKKDIRELIDMHGFQTDGYWENLRTLSIEYWKNLDRNNIFIEKIYK